MAEEEEFVRESGSVKEVEVGGWVCSLDEEVVQVQVQMVVMVTART